MKTRTAGVVILLVIGLAVGASLVNYSALPERMPTHWDLQGHANGWTGRFYASLIAPEVMLLILVFLLAGDWLSPVHFKVGAFRSAFNYLMVIVAALLAYVHLLLLDGALHPGRPHARWLVGGLFLFLAWLGNMLGKTRRNFWVGIRTPWALASDAVWIATHRLAGRLLLAAGIIGAIAIAAGMPVSWSVPLTIGVLLVPVFYSLWLSKKLEKEAEQLSEEATERLP